MTISRRDVLRSSVSAGLAVATIPHVGFIMSSATSAAESPAKSPQTAGAPEKLLPIIDTHQHLWDLEKLRIEWIDKKSPLARSFVTSDYLKEVAGHNVAGTVYMEVDVAQDDKHAEKTREAKHVLSLCEDKKNLTRGAVIGGIPANDSFAVYVRQFKDDKRVKGVRQILHAGIKQGACLEKPFVKSVQLLGELGLCFDLCMRPDDLLDGAKLADLCPDTRFVLDHCGNADPKAWNPKLDPAAKPDHTVDGWKRDLADIAKRKNVICKISGIVARAVKGKWKSDDLAPIVNFCLETFGPERVVFGSDWPVCTLGASLGEWIVALREIISPRPQVQQRKLLSENAQRFYGLE